MFNQKRNLKYPSLFLICFFISTALYLNSCGRFFIKDEGVENKSIEELSGVSSAKTNIDGLNTTISEITQTVGSDGLLAGSFVVPFLSFNTDNKKEIPSDGTTKDPV